MRAHTEADLAKHTSLHGEKNDVNANLLVKMIS